MRCRLGMGWGMVRVNIILALFMSVGCRQEPNRWDPAQADSEGKTAQESSADRMKAGAAKSSESAAEEPPPFTPGAPNAADGPVTWKPKGGVEASGGLADDDITALTTGAPLPGGEFNKFFPEQSGSYDRVAKQEKQGFAEYSLRRDGEEIAQLSVTDLRSNPQAAAKFQQPDMMVAGYPAKKDGSKGTTLLVEKRFQVKVRSPGGQLNEADRVKWLKAFNLDGIAGLAN